MTDVLIVIEPEVVTVEVATAETVLVDVGTQGPPGVPGTPGAGYVHSQASAAVEWTVNHNLGVRPGVSVVDTGGAELDAEVVHMNMNQTKLFFTLPTAGFARLT